MIGKWRRSLLLVSSILLVTTTIVVASTNAKRGSNIRGVRSRNRWNSKNQHTDERNLELPPDVDLVFQKDEDEGYPNMENPPSKNTKQETVPQDLFGLPSGLPTLSPTLAPTVEKKGATDLDLQNASNAKPNAAATKKTKQEETHPSTEPTLTPTLEPNPASLERDNAKPELVTSESKTSSSGMLAGVIVGALGIALVIIFFATRHKKRRTTKLKETDAAKDGVDEDYSGPFEGTFQMVEHKNFDEFLSALDISWAVRSAATRARPIHSITHKENLITMKFKGIPRATYAIDGPPNQNVLCKCAFECKARYTDDNDGFEVHQEGLDQVEYNIHLCWKLSEDKETVNMTLTIDFKDDEKESVKCTQVYSRAGKC